MFAWWYLTIEFFYSIQTFSWFYPIGINCFILNLCRGIIFPRLHQKTSKISLKDLFYKDSPESDGLICAGPLIEYIPFNEPLSSLPLLMVHPLVTYKVIGFSFTVNNRSQNISCDPFKCFW